jgi:4-amino-4-deoxy-L-arabinose transferase-like glycosyltransferase
VGAVTRLLYWAAATPEWTPRSDADQYVQLARNLAAGDGYSLAFPQLELHATAFRPPLYPLLLAIPTWVTGGDALWPGRLLSLLLGLAVIALTVVFVHRLGGPVAALAAGLAVALYPPLIANDTVTLTEPLALSLLLGVLITLDRREAVSCGVLSGLLMLTRPNAYLVVVIIGIALWRSVGPRRAAAMAGVSLLVLTPWMVRNQVQVGTFRLTTSEGFNLTAMYSEEAQESNGFVDPVYDPRFDGTGPRLAQFNEALWNAELTRHGLDGLRSRPTYPLRVAGRNLKLFLEISPSGNNSPELLDGRNLELRRRSLPLFYAVTAAGLCGLWLHRRNRALWPAMFIVAQFALLSLLLVSPPRLRAPLDLLMCIGLGLLVGWFADRRHPQRHPSPRAVRSERPIRVGLTAQNASRDARSTP